MYSGIYFDVFQRPAADEAGGRSVVAELTVANS